MKTQMKWWVGLSLVLSSLLFSTGAWALTLDQAKQQGRVGETLSGYLAPVKKDAETLMLVAQINAAREQKYQEVAKNNHVPTDEVAKLAGQKLVNRAQPGEFVRGINGQWMQR
ncbi:YdbL family protein [Yersinia nurmii]|uniref:YdbL family protein n=1 Tax=Yersinia nurmii TaxID=685706 RepID=A0AAW7JYQ2_9GAMM|nr:YdbL family protein [Yersinia nurmii]MDN0087378.1 YdbL family protein [Yersinia nurmii]